MLGHLRSRFLAPLLLGAAVAACSADVSLASHSARAVGAVAAAPVESIEVAAPIALSVPAPRMQFATFVRVPACRGLDSGIVLRVPAVACATPIARTDTVRRASDPARRTVGNLPAGSLGLLLVGMTALASERDTKSRRGLKRTYDVLGGAKIYQGGIVVLTAAGYVKAGATAVGLVVVGRALQTVDNTAGASGDLTVEVEEGEFLFANSAAGDAITRTSLGTVCYLVDDQTVAKTDNSGARSSAGIITGVEDAGVWVRLGIANNG